MPNTYKYSNSVDEALRSYGARTHGTLERRVERLKRFTDLRNKHYAAEIRLEHAREEARRNREYRVGAAIDELNKREFLNMLDRWQPPQVCNHHYNLRSRDENGLHMLAHAAETLENGFARRR